MRNTGPSRRIRQLVIDRDDHCCVACGHWVDVEGGNYSLQHRRARGAGGSRRSDTNSLANLILMCGSATTGCHGYVEAHPDYALSRGYRVTQQQDPALVPVWVAGWGEVLLDPDQPMYVGVSDYPEGA